MRGQKLDAEFVGPAWRAPWDFGGLFRAAEGYLLRHMFFLMPARTVATLLTPAFRFFSTQQLAWQGYVTTYVTNLGNLCWAATSCELIDLL